MGDLIQLVYFNDVENKGHETIFVDLVGEEFLLFNSNYVDLLWDKYRIAADSIDETLNEYGSKHLPAILQPEQVQVLMECDFVRVRQMVNFDGFTTPVKVNHRELLTEEEKQKVMKRAERNVCGHMIKERKRKACPEHIPAKVRKVTEADIDAEIESMVLDDGAVKIAFEEIMSRNRGKADSYVNLVHEAPKNFYEILQLNQVPFPTTQEYRNRLTVFRDLWRKGLFLTSGFKFGCHFLAYEASPTKVHSKYMVFCRSPSDSLLPSDLAALSRVGSQVKKKILIALVSSDTLIPYYMKMSWWKGQK